MSETDTLEWSSDYSLTWSDFKAEYNPAIYEDSHSVIKYRFTWTVNSDAIDDDILFFIENIQLFTEFHPLLSWVRPTEANDVLLKHEQGTFDLAEKINRENLKNLQNNFYEKQFATRGKNDDQRKQFAKIDSGKMIVSEVKKLDELFEQQSQEYHKMTCFGQNIEKQSEYDLIFDKLRL